MRLAVNSRPSNWVRALHRFAQGQKSAADVEICEFCAAPLSSDHRHLAEPGRALLHCVCQSCATLLGNRPDKKYRIVPEEIRKLENFSMNDAAWDGMGIPAGLAFFYFSTARGRIAAFYPGSGGPAESLLDLGAWTAIAADNPVLADMEPDVEALLVNRLNGARDYYRMPIDRCYALAGLIRTHWRGISGGSEAWDAISGFFASIEGRDREGQGGAWSHG